MKTPANLPERLPDPDRQQAEQRIRQKLGRLTWLQRITLGGSLALGIASGWIDGENIADEQRLGDVSAVVGALPVVALAAGSTAVAKRQAHKGCEKLVAGYAAVQMGGAGDRFHRTELSVRDDKLEVERVVDPAVREGTEYDASIAGIGWIKHGSASLLSYGGAHFVSLAASEIFPYGQNGPIQGIGIAGVALGVMLETFEEGSAKAHASAYIAQLDNIDGGLSFRT